MLREGAWADITVFDLARVRDAATYDEPVLFPEGIEYVLVNGEVVIEDGGNHTGARPGHVLYGPGLATAGTEADGGGEAGSAQDIARVAARLEPEIRRAMLEGEHSFADDRPDRPRGRALERCVRRVEPVGAHPRVDEHGLPHRLHLQGPVHGRAAAADGAGQLRPRRPGERPSRRAGDPRRRPGAAGSPSATSSRTRRGCPWTSVLTRSGGRPRRCRWTSTCGIRCAWTRRRSKRSCTRTWRILWSATSWRGSRACPTSSTSGNGSGVLWG